MKLNRHHIDYSDKNELLAMIPLKPVPVTTICSDLGLPHKTIYSLVRALRMQGYRIVLHRCHISQSRNPGGMHISMSPDSWNRAQLQAELYWARVYGPTPYQGDSDERQRNHHRRTNNRSTKAAASARSGRRSHKTWR